MSLTDNEFTVLMIAAQGESMMAIAHWKQPVESLVAKGYLQSRGGDNFNCVITPAGRAACEARDREDMDAFKNAVGKVFVTQPMKKHSIGPHVIQGRLFFKMPDGRSITCTCIGEPFASQIVALWEHRGD